ncbi:MAG: DUF128 domain-containing protein [Candidatus Abyssobacteria bacterium SURF_17]|uniref:DUF128 domain-containing protein n=1 Tax=Candidatus Abyssobacteria bacterium SURF_17 TaxID=2093361 RepID=A0A419EWL7_9BACT|nr:MAG: DUF128 domain-containing protein [Candidatus Abyssubacteria bacterium SURF_17]
MSEKTEKQRLAILRILQESDTPLSSSTIADRLLATGHDMSERTVRLYLRSLDEEGLTANMGRRGRIVTHRGSEELSSARIIERVGFLAAKIDQMTYRMTFDLSTQKGSVVVNVSVIENSHVECTVPLIRKVFTAGYAMGRLIALFSPGERIGDATVPHGMIGIGTVCSITINGVLLAHGIPTYSKFGGLLELENYKPTRFVEAIYYEGSTLDPLEVFIRSGMTDCAGAAETGSGRIGASFREAPADCREQVIALAHRLERVGLGGFMTVGWPSQPLLEIPVQQERVGAVIMGGLNPIAILEENGIRTQSRALAALADYETLFPYDELDSHICGMV